MKKVFFSLAVLATVALVSCGGKKAENADTLAETTVETEEVVAVTEDSPKADSPVAEAVEATETVEAAAPADSAK